MKTIAALGPVNTFSEVVAKRYAEQHVPDAKVQLFPTIKKVFSMVGKKCEFGILPIENMLDGYIPKVLDLLLHSRLTVIDELLLPINFNFAANCSNVKDVKRIFVQFVSQGQCGDFIDSLPSNIEIITTESNGESFERLLHGSENDGAVIPSHTLHSAEFPLIVENISDYLHNQTRFVVIAEQESEYDKKLSYKTSIVIMEGTDRPGTLSEILSAFANRNVNLLSIMSRPTKESMGKYHFFIDIDGYALDKVVQDALTEVRKYGFVKLIGSFPKADQSLDSPVSHDELVKYPINPWNNNETNEKRKRKVIVAQGDDPYQNTRSVLAAIDHTPVKGKKVLLKPNVGRVAKGNSGVVTNPQVVAAAIDFFREAGAALCVVGESPITGVDVMEAFDVSGISAVCSERNCPMVNLDKRSPVKITLPNAVALEKVSVCGDVFDFDIIVSIPVMKMHMHTGVTLSIKNMKGCLWGRSKVDLHMLPPVPYCEDKPLNVAVADMASVLFPHLSIIDGTVGMEGLGPSAGNPKPLGVVLASTSALEADSVACELMGVAPSSVPHLRILSERGFGDIDTKNIDITPNSWKLFIQPFEEIPNNLAIKYPNVTILDENSCSACQSTLLMFLKRNGEHIADYFKNNGSLTVVIGKGHKEVPVNALCIGNCTRVFRENATFISGCPPVASSILKSLKKDHR